MLQLLICYKMFQLCSLKLLDYIKSKSFPHSPVQANTCTSRFHAMPDILQPQAECELLQFTFELAELYSLTKDRTALYLILFFTFPQIADAKYLFFLVLFLVLFFFFYTSEQKCFFLVFTLFKHGKMVSRTPHADMSLKSDTVIKKGYNAQFSKYGNKNFGESWVMSNKINEWDVQNPQFPSPKPMSKYFPWMVLTGCQWPIPHILDNRHNFRIQITLLVKLAYILLVG